MRDFRPVVAPPGRLVRLSLVLDPRNAPTQTKRVSQMAERAGLQALWVNDRFLTSDGLARMEAWTMLTIAAMFTSKIRVGIMFSSGLRSPQATAAMVGSMDDVIGGRLELGAAAGWYEKEHVGLGLPFPNAAARIDEMGRFARILTTLARGEPLTEGGPVLGLPSPQPDGPALTLEARGPRQLAIAVGLADNVLLPTRPISEIAAMVETARSVAAEADRDPDSLGFAVQLPVSVGRTNAESDVRVEIDDMLAQMDTRALGIHGDLEQCQDIMIELAHFGIGEVRCVLPNTADIDDVIAQLTATTVGTKDILKPGAARSEAPPPPPGWGGPGKPQKEQSGSAPT
ncbi:MAG TPA: LLM class flavin-dependent oxidoreductase [Acidimicrobiia bacterium]|nr:LLM class flavin-dependent oxidoreductase [Acidimicrobiia bacterium]